MGAIIFVGARLRAARHSPGSGGRRGPARLVGDHRARRRPRGSADPLELRRRRDDRPQPADPARRPGERAEGEGVVEEIGLVYTRIKQDDRTRLVIPNDRLASDTIKNSTIVSRERLAEITVPVPRDKDLRAVVDLLREVAAPTELLVTGLDGDAVVTLRAWADDEASARLLESELHPLRARAARRRYLRMSPRNAAAASGRDSEKTTPGAGLAETAPAGARRHRKRIALIAGLSCRRPRLRRRRRDRRCGDDRATL